MIREAETFSCIEQHKTIPRSVHRKWAPSAMEGFTLVLQNACRKRGSPVSVQFTGKSEIGKMSQTLVSIGEGFSNVRQEGIMVPDSMREFCN